MFTLWSNSKVISMTISALLDLRIAMAHYHIPKLVPHLDECSICGLDISDPVHAIKNINRQRQTSSIVAAAIPNRKEGP